MSFDPSSLRDFADRPLTLREFASPTVPDRRIGAALAALSVASIQVTMAEADLNGIVARLAAGIPPKGADPLAVLNAAFDRIDAARDHLNSERLRVTNADDHSPCGRLDASDWSMVFTGLRGALDAITHSELSNLGDYSETNRLTASDVVRTGRAA